MFQLVILKTVPFIMKFSSNSASETTLISEVLNPNNKKIKEVKVTDGVISTGADEAALFIMDDGTVMYAYKTSPIDGSKSEIVFKDFELLKDVKVSKINSIRTSAGDQSATTICDVVLTDGTQKIIEK